MQAIVYQHLISNPELLHFVRMNPIWYRRLTRYPEQVYQLNQFSKQYYGKTFHHRLGKVSQNIQLVNMLLSMGELLQEQ